MKKAILLSSIVCAISQQAFANEISADLNPDSFHAQFDATHATNGIIYSGDLLLTTDQGKYIGAAMLTDGQVGRNAQLSGGLGGKIYAIDDDSDTFGALAIGGRLRYTIPNYTDLSLATEVFYAPSITTTEDSTSLIEFSLRAEYKMFENAALYGGVRHVEANYDNGFEHEFDSGPHAGIRIEF